MQFAFALAKGEQLPLEELGSEVGVGHAGSLGKYTSGLVSRRLGGMMPGSYNSTSIDRHLSNT